MEITVESCIDGKELTDNEVTKRAAEFESKLRDHGFVWSPIGKERCCCEPGIPSLMITYWNGKLIVIVNLRESASLDFDILFRSPLVLGVSA